MFIQSFFFRFRRLLCYHRQQVWMFYFAKEILNKLSKNIHSLLFFLSDHEKHEKLNKSREKSVKWKTKMRKWWWRKSSTFWLVEKIRNHCYSSDNWKILSWQQLTNPSTVAFWTQAGCQDEVKMFLMRIIIGNLPPDLTNVQSRIFRWFR